MKNQKFINHLKKKYDRNFFYFDEFMEESLYSEFGYFSNGKVRSSKEGDFLTSPEVSNFFGVFVSKWLISNNLDNDSNVLEIGAGTGSLAKQISNYLSKDIYVTELSKNAQKALNQENIILENNLESYMNKNVDAIYMNEILDNIPCSVGKQIDNQWFEKTVEIDKNENLAYGQVEMREKNIDWIERYNFLNNQDNDLEIQLNSEYFLDELIKLIDPKYLLIFDYGFRYDDRNSKPYKSTIRTYKDHHFSSEPISMPTETDITYDVNFTFLKKYFSNNNFEVQLIYQYEFLDNFGYDQLYKELHDKFIQTSNIEQLKIKSELVGLEAIHNERGLGGFYTLEAKKV